MKTTLGDEFEIPQGVWKHLKKSQEWETYNENYAKGKNGYFSETGKYLKWDSSDGKVTMFIEVHKIRIALDTLLLTHRSGLMYWFKKEGKDGSSKKKEEKTAEGRNTSSGYGK